jgi:putative membrane protein
MQVTDKLREDVRVAVIDLEKSTSGELVCVIARASARYMLFPVIWAAIVALALPLLNPLLEQAGYEPAVTFSIQSVVFIGLALLFLYSPLRLCVTPRSVKDSNCRRTAFEQFFLRKLHNTQHRTGVLLFVSVEEHHVELVADQGISEKVTEAEWDAILDTFAADLKAGRVHEGFVAAIAACKAVLAKHCPELPPGGKNELDDRLVELPEPQVIN